MQKHFLSLTAFVAIFIFSQCEKKPTTPDWNSETQDIQHTFEDKNSPTASELSSGKTAKSNNKGSKSDIQDVRFMYFNLRNYLTMRRGKEYKSKPEAEKKAVVSNIVKQQPDILAVCEIGDEADVKDLYERLKLAGLDLKHTYLINGSDKTRRQAVFSRFAITPHSTPRMTYTMKDQEFQVRRGILDASIETPAGTYRFIGAHLKSKRPSKEFDHNLIRRNEALILRKHVTKLLEQENPPNLIVYGDMNDTKRSESVRTIKGPSRGNQSLRYVDLKAEDGTKWTHHWSTEDIYSRIDFVFYSKTTSAHINTKQSYICMVPKGDIGSDHRALLVILRK